MALTLCEHACKTVSVVKQGIDPCPSPAQSWYKAYQISGCTVARKKFRCCQKIVKLLLEQLQVCIVEIVFGVRCTLSGLSKRGNIMVKNEKTMLKKCFEKCYRRNCSRMQAITPLPNQMENLQ